MIKFAETEIGFSSREEAKKEQDLQDCIDLQDKNRYRNRLLAKLRFRKQSPIPPSYSYPDFSHS